MGTTATGQKSSESTESTDQASKPVKPVASIIGQQQRTTFTPSVIYHLSIYPPMND
jgi:hypothetical protein